MRAAPAREENHALGLRTPADQPVVTCEVPVPPELLPDGTTNWIFRVTGFFRS